MAEYKYVCVQCQGYFCNECIDIMRVVSGLPSVCKCARPGHSGEPRDKQILDPITGEIFAPGLKVMKDGKVRYDR